MSDSGGYWPPSISGLGDEVAGPVFGVDGPDQAQRQARRRRRRTCPPARSAAQVAHHVFEIRGSDLDRGAPRRGTGPRRRRGDAGRWVIRSPPTAAGPCPVRRDPQAEDQQRGQAESGTAVTAITAASGRAWRAPAGPPAPVIQRRTRRTRGCGCRPSGSPGGRRAPARAPGGWRERVPGHHAGGGPGEGDERHAEQGEQQQREHRAGRGRTRPARSSARTGTRRRAVTPSTANEAEQQRAAGHRHGGQQPADPAGLPGPVAQRRRRRWTGTARPWPARG